MKRVFLTFAAVAAVMTVAAPAAMADEALAKSKNCMACHAIDKKLVGPSYKDVAKKNAGNAAAADLLVIATDVNAAFIDFGKPTQKAIGQAHPDDMEKLGFAAGSMGPKVQAACEFARNTGKTAVIGSLSDIEAIVQGTAGTRVSTAKPG